MLVPAVIVLLRLRVGGGQLLGVDRHALFRQLRRVLGGIFEQFVATARAAEVNALSRAEISEYVWLNLLAADGAAQK